MRKEFFCIAVALVVGCLGFPSVSASASKLTLNYASHSPGPTSPRGMQEKWLCDEIMKQTNGRVIIKTYWGESLLKVNEILEGVKNGTADMGSVIVNYYSDKLPLHDVALIVPFTTGDPVKLMKIGRGLYEQIPEYGGQLEQIWNQKKIAIGVVGSYHLICAKKRIATFADLKGLRIRTFGNVLPKHTSAAGAVPVTVSAGELYEAMQKGIIDAALFSLDATKRWKLYEVAKYVSLIDYGGWPEAAAYTINLDTWKKISPEDQKTILKVGKEAEDFEVELTLKEEADLVEFMKKRGIEFVEFPAADREKWRTLPQITEGIADWVKRREAEGLPAKKAMDVYMKLEGLK